MTIDIKNNQLFIDSVEFPMPSDMIYMKLFFGNYTREIALEEYTIYVWDDVGLYASGSREKIDAISFLLFKGNIFNFTPHSTFQGQFSLDGNDFLATLPLIGRFDEHSKSYIYDSDTLEVAGSILEVEQNKVDYETFLNQLKKQKIKIL